MAVHNKRGSFHISVAVIPVLVVACLLVVLNNRLSVYSNEGPDEDTLL